MIPKTIHYIWFGPAKPEETLECIDSWKNKNPDFEIKEWNEINFPVEKYPFASRMYNEKKWSFLSDYARLIILYEEGGFYLDTDMLLLQSIWPLTQHTCVLGEESPGIISAGMIGAEKNHPFIQKAREVYDKNPKELITIPRVLSQVYESYENKDSLTVLSPETFYPFDSEHIKEFHGQDLGKAVFGVHLWHYSWGSPLNKFFKKIGIHKLGTKIAEKLGIKAFLKKILGFV